MLVEWGKTNSTMAHQIMLIPKPILKYMRVQKSLTLSCNVKNALKYLKKLLKYISWVIISLIAVYNKEINCNK